MTTQPYPPSGGTLFTLGLDIVLLSVFILFYISLRWHSWIIFSNAISLSGNVFPELMPNHLYHSCSHCPYWLVALLYLLSALFRLFTSRINRASTAFRAQMLINDEIFVDTCYRFDFICFVIKNEVLCICYWVFTYCCKIV